MEASLDARHGTSDEFYDPYCDSCYEDGGQNVRAFGFCKDCVQFLCTACRSVHRRLQATRQHHVVNGEDMPKSQAEKPPRFDSCDVHPKRLKDKFCCDHRILLCSICSSSVHNGCSIKKVEDVSKIIDVSGTSSLYDRTKRLKETLKSTLVTTEKAMLELKGQEKTMLYDAQKLYDQIIAQANKLFGSVKHEIQASCQSQISDLSQRRKNVSDMLLKIDSPLTVLGEVKAKPIDTKVFLTLQENVSYTKKVANELQELRKSLKFVSFSFLPSQPSQEFLSPSFTLGKIQKSESNPLGADITVPEIMFPVSALKETTAQPNAGQMARPQNLEGAVAKPLLPRPNQLLPQTDSELQTKLRQYQKDNRKLREENENLTVQMRRGPSHTEEISRLKKENEELKCIVQTSAEEHNHDGATKDDKNASIMKNKYERISMQLEHLNRKYKEKKAENKKLKKNIEELLAEKLNLEKKCENHNFKIKSLEQIVQNTEKQNKATNQQNERKHKNLRDKLEQTEKELQETKLRLSEYMGHQLADSNPNIADLSDQNRPTKIGEMFDSLYDDEYTQAFEEIDVDYTTNSEICKTLLDLLMEAKKFCDDNAAHPMRALKRECLVQDTTNMSADSSLIENSLKEIKDIRKKNAREALKAVYEKFAKHMTYTKKASIFRQPNRYAKTVEYARKCVEVCWLMAVQDPPMAFGPLPRHYDLVDSNLYRPYTKSGREVDFVVWPVLYLHDNGPVLCKGVLEPIKHDYQYTVVKDNERRYEESRTDRNPTRTSISPSNIQPSSFRSSGRDILLTNDRTRNNISSRSNYRFPTERAAPSYQQEILTTEYNRLYSPSSYTPDRYRWRKLKY